MKHDIVTQTALFVSGMIGWLTDGLKRNIIFMTVQWTQV